MQRLVCFTFVLCALGLMRAGTAGEAGAWVDPSGHRIQRVTVESSVELEVLDWGGSGRTVVLLAGGGNSAHVFDRFAEKLAAQFRVFGITRRGSGASSIPGTGYNADRLADDVLAVLDSLSIQSPILIGHSVANEEMNSFAARYPQRAAGLVYLDAAYDRTDPAGRAPLQKLGQSVPPPDPPSTEDLFDFRSIQRWSQRARGIDIPEAELRQCCQWDSTDHFVKFEVNAARNEANRAIASAARKPAYGTIRVPALAIYAVAQSGKDIPGYREQYTAAFEDTYLSRVPYVKDQVSHFRNEVKSSRVVEMPGANHYVFLSNESAVLREVTAFAKEIEAARQRVPRN